MSLRSRLVRDDAGLSLMEMIITMMIASVLFLVLGTLFVSSFRENRTVNGKTTSTLDGRIAMEAMTRELRVAIQPSGQAAAITAASATSITFYTSIGTTTQTTDPTPEQITLTADATRHCLYRSITPGSGGTWPSSGTKSACVARGDIASPLFTYYGINGDDTISTTAFTTAQLPTNLANIAAVGLSLSITDTANPAVTATTLQDQVTLINVQTTLANS